MKTLHARFSRKPAALRNVALLFALPLLAMPALGVADTASAAGKTVRLTAADNGKEVTLHPGDTLIITLGNPGDGGYDNCYVQPTGDMMRMASLGHERTGASQPGNFGSDVYTFVTAPELKGLKDASEGEWMRFIALRPFERGDNVSLGSGVQFNVTVAG